MKRKYSISFGVGIAFAIAYLVLVVVYLYGVFQEYNTGFQAYSMQELLKQLVPHLICAVVGTILVIIAFFTDTFGVALAASISFGIAIVLALGDYIQYAILCSPSTIATIIGTVLCYQRKERRKEIGEKRNTPNTHSQPKAQQQKTGYDAQPVQNNIQQPQVRQGTYSPYAQNTPGMMNANNTYQQPFAQHRSVEFRRPIYQQPSFQQPQDPFAPMHQNNAQQLYGNIYQNMSFVNDPQFANQMGASPYDPLTINQPNQQMMNQPMMNQFNQQFQPVQQPMNVNQLQYQQSQNNNMNMNNGIFPASNNQRTLADGYFDDHGNFHSGNGNKI